MVKVRFRLTETKRTALFKQSSHGEYARSYDQTGWGTTVKLTQVYEGATTVPMELVLSGAEAKLFEDAPIGQEFEIAISPVK